jgi:hypothetical protein
VKIEIANKLIAFSKSTSGVRVVLPGTFFVFIIHPAFIEVEGQETLALEVEGPVLDFTVSLDLLKADIHVYGITKKGYIHYRIYAHNNSYAFETIKDQTSKLPFSKKSLLEKKEIHFERLSLGVHKKQEVESFEKRQDLKEILPFLFLLGQHYKKSHLLLSHKPKSYQELFELYFLTFKGFFVPKLNLHLGIKNSIENEALPLSFSSDFSGLIRDLFIKEDKDILYILPSLFPQFPSGRMVDIKLFEGKMLLSLEWSKKKIAKVIIKTLQPLKFSLHFPSEVDRFRVRSCLKDAATVLFNKTELKIDGQKILYLDRFI